jgi:hypothetical protein
MKYTLLEMVQDILNDMDSDEVNDIDDTVESTQVAQIVKTCYFEWIANRNWPHLRELIALSNGSVDKPTHMRVPDNVKQFEWVKYDIRKEDTDNMDFKTIRYLEPEDFLHHTNHRRSNDDNILVVEDYGANVKLLIQNDTYPRYWTSFADDNIVFDAYDVNHGSALVSSKLQALAYVNPTWTMSNEFVPDLPIEAFPGLLEEAKSTAFFTLKQMQNDKAEQKASRQKRWLSRKAWKNAGGIKYPNYGRRRSKGTDVPLDKTSVVVFSYDK